MAARRARNPGLGALFLLLGVALIGVAYAAAKAAGENGGLYVVVAASGLLALWLLGLAAKLLRPR